MVNWYSGDPSEDARKYVLRLCTVMSRRLRSKMRKLVLVLELFSTRIISLHSQLFFFFSICAFYSLNIYPFFFFFFKSTNHHEMRLPLLRKRRSARYPPTVDQRLTVLLRDRAHYLSFGVTANCTSAFVDDGNIV